MRVYVASRFSPEGIEKVKDAQAKLIAAGHKIVHDWTKESADGKEGKELAEYLAVIAMTDLTAVRLSEALIFINVDDKTMRGAYVEAGVALGLFKRVIVVDAKPGTLNMPGSCIFFMLPFVIKVATIEEAIEALNAN